MQRCQYLESMNGDGGGVGKENIERQGVTVLVKKQNKKKNIYIYIYIYAILRILHQMQTRRHAHYTQGRTNTHARSHPQI